MDENRYMRRAIELAKKGAGHVNPNPLVGAVIVKDGRVIGEGFHEIYGSLHAERNALKSCLEAASGAEMYVTLEPCCHRGKQPPCTDAIINAGIKRVYVGSADPNPKVAGGGISRLRAAGIEVIENVMRDECDALNPVFFKYICTGEPYIALKYAMTADGRIAADSGLSQWISGKAARENVHRLRNYYSGILAGIGTVLADDPMLNCRIPGGRDPVRIVLDTRLRIPLGSRLVQTVQDIPLIIICGESSEGGDELENKKQLLRQSGAEIIEVPAINGHVSINAALKCLGAKGIDGILVEGGAKIHGAFIEAGKADRIYAYIGARILSGTKLRAPVTGAGAESPETAVKLGRPQLKQFGDDVRLRYDVIKEAD